MVLPMKNARSIWMVNNFSRPLHNMFRQHTFRDICGSNSARRTQNPMMEINAKIISYIHSSIFKSSGSEKKKKLKIVSEPKHHHQSVGDFCVLDSVPGENCNNLYEVLFILYYDY